MRRLLSPTSLAALAFLMFWGIMAFWAARSPLAGQATDLAYDALFYPGLLILIGSALAVAVLVIGILTKSDGEGLVNTRNAAESGQSGVEAVHAAGLATAFVLLLEPLGFFLTSALFVVAFSFVFGFRRLPVVLALAVGTSLAVWLLFTQGLRAPLPEWPAFLS